MDKGYIVVLITTPSKEVGEKIAHTLLEKKLAACVNMVAPIFSLYTWEGEIKTYAGSIPIIMRFAQEGKISASVGDQTESAKTDWAQLHLIASTASWLLGTFDGRIPTDDTKRYPHNILLSIGKQGEKLIGEATAVVPWSHRKHTRMYAGLSHYVELTRLND